MYEPKYLPQLNETVGAFSGMRFSVVYNNKYSRLDDPDADPMHVHNCLEIFINVSSDSRSFAFFASTNASYAAW